MLEAISRKPFGIIYFSVKPYNGCDIMQTKIGKIGFRRMQGIPIVNLALGMRTTESNEFFRNQPIEISILNFLIMFIFVTVKIIEVKISGLK